MRRMSLSILRFVLSPFIRRNTLTLLRPTRAYENSQSGPRNRLLEKNGEVAAHWVSF